MNLFPNAMYRTRRGICPQCGAPQPLDGATATITCAFCGSKSTVERRLRTTEPEVEKAVEWLGTDAVEAALERIPCPGCGGRLEFDGSTSIIRCKSCGTESKVERRMKRVQPPSRPAGPPPDIIRTIVEGTDLADRVAAAMELNNWPYINAGTAAHMPELLEAAQKSDPRLGHAIAETVCKMLCQGDVALRDATLRAAERVIFDVNGSRNLLFQIGMGSGVCLKLLLDVAEWAAAQGAVDYACTALWGAGYIFDRNYPEHEVMAQIVLYRMMYLHGPVLAWALRFAQGQGGIGYRYPQATLLRFLDDCAEERPNLAPEIARCFYEGTAKTEGEFRSRLDLLQNLKSVEAREAAIRVLGAPPKGASLRIIETARALLASLPKEAGKTPMSEPTPASSEMEQAKLLWEEGLRRAVDAHDAQSKALHDYWERIQHRTPFMVAATKGDVKKMRELLDAGTDVNEQDPNRRTALMHAGTVEAVRELLARGADASLRDTDEKTAFMQAVEEGRVEIVEALLEIADIDQKQESYRLAFQKRRPAMMELLIEKGADPDTMEENGATPLILAAAAGDEEVVRILLEGGARVDHADQDGKTAIMHAEAHPAVMKLLRERGAELPPPPLPSLVEAVQERSLEKVKIALDAGVDPNTRDGGGTPVAYRAMNRSKPEILMLLLERGADANISFPSDTLLSRAVVIYSIEIIEELIRRGADVNAQKQWGDTALMTAAAKGYVDVARILLKHGANPKLLDKRGDGPLAHASIRRDNDEMIRFLKESGAEK